MTDARLNPQADQETEITLGVLDAVAENASVTQRSVARELGIALGLANSYLKRCVKKGLIKVQQAPANRYAYYLTPKGFAEKSRLSAEYLKSSFTFFRRARAQCEEALGQASSAGWRRVALIGVSELAEIAALCGHEYEIELVVVTPDAASRPKAAGLQTFADLDAAGPLDGALITDLDQPQAAFDRTVATLGAQKVMAPRLLRIRAAAAGQIRAGV